MEVAEVFGIFTVFHLSVRRYTYFSEYRKIIMLMRGIILSYLFLDFHMHYFILKHFKKFNFLWFLWHLYVRSEIKCECIRIRFFCQTAVFDFEQELSF